MRSKIAAIVLLAACGGDADSSGGNGQDGGDDATTDTGETSDTSAGDCTPGQLVCADPLTVGSCTASGVLASAPCPEAQGCEAGVCVPQVCVPGEGRGECLSPTSHEICSPSGARWDVVNCGPGATCKNGACAGQLCIPGSKVCAGFTQVRECNEAGDAFIDLGACPNGGTCSDGECISPCDANIKNGSYLGCEYWVLDLDNIEEAEFQPVGVVVSVPAGGEATEVRMTSSATGQLVTAAELGVSDLFVSPGQVKVFSLPTGHDIDGTSRSARSFRLLTTSPVTVHQFNPLNGSGVFSNDASLLLPAAVTGKEYLVMAWPHRDEGTVLRGFVTIVATQPGNTVVELVSTSTIAAGGNIAGIQAGESMTFTLAAGEVVNLETGGADGQDLTGTRILGSQRFSVIAGHECANVPVGISACDHIEQQLFPVETWGNIYIADGFEPRSASQIDIWRVMAGANEVSVTTDPPVPGYESFVLQKGQWVQFAAQGSFAVSGDGPISVGHYLSGSAYPGADKVCEGLSGDTGLGDPAFSLAVPATRYLTEYSVLTPTGYEQDYLNIIARPDTTIMVDGVALAEALKPVGASGWATATIAVDPGVHNVEGSAPFGLTAYGYDCDVSYAYPGGLQLQGTGDSP